MKFSKWVIASLVAGVLGACGKVESQPQLTDPGFEDVSVHDPSIIKSNDSFYIVGSHAALAKTTDLIKWQQLSTSVNTDIQFENIREELKEEFEYAQTDTLWASDIIQLKDGRYYLYYCLCRGDSPLSVLGVAVSDSIEGPFKKIESFLYSGTSPQFGEEYDAKTMPNAIDPDVFYDKNGKLWMVYGSYSGGIFILEMDENTGLPLDRNTYGKKLMGGNHARIEGPYILYHPKTDYYYLFTSFGGLTADGGYNMRVARSKTPDGPYHDILGNDMIDAIGIASQPFADKAIQDYGNKLMGNFLVEEDDGLTNSGYVSPGHNSAYYDGETGKTYLIFHTRFPNGGEMHQVRVHQLLFTQEGWPLVVPFRYANEELVDVREKEIPGTYRLVLTQKAITDYISEPRIVELKEKVILDGELSGEWTIPDSMLDEDATVIIDNITYKGKFIEAWDNYNEKSVLTFTGVSEEGLPLYLLGEE